MLRHISFAFFMAGFILPAQSQLHRFSFTEPKMGSPFTIIFYTSDSFHANSTVQHCFTLVDSLVNIFSDYIDSSELNRVCARAGTGVWFHCSVPLFEILLTAQRAYTISGHRFDISVGPLTRLWRKARKEKLFPDSTVIHEKKFLTGFNKVELNTSSRSVRLLQTGMQLDLGGIAQGYIAQKVINYLKTNGIHIALVDVSGDIACIGKPSGKKGWTVAINLPESKEELLPNNLLITNQAVTTSGDVYQFMEHDGKRYSHIVDPVTGYGITSQRNVTVIAGDGTTADWLTKACSLLPINQGKKLALSLHAEVLIAEMKADKVVYYETKGFRKYWDMKK